MTKKPLMVKGCMIVAGILAVYFAVDFIQGDQAEKTTQQAYVQAVSTLKVKLETLPVIYNLPGRVVPFRQSEVRPQVDGIILKQLFVEGTNVQQGDQLYQIDDARYSARYNSALADLKSAQSTQKTIAAKERRHFKLLQSDAVSRQIYDEVKTELDQAQAAVVVAQAAVDLAKVDLDYTKVYAPVAGRIGKSYVTEGALVTANQSQYLAVITQLDPVYVDIQQSSTEAMRMQSFLDEGDNVAVNVILEDNDNQLYPHSGILKFAEVTVNQSSGSITLRAEMPNPKGNLLPGLFVMTQLNFGEKNVLLVPQRATIRQPDGQLMVWVVNDKNTAQPRVIDAIHSYQSNWIVNDGLKVGERIIIEGYQKVQPGLTVSPMPWQQQQDATAVVDAVIQQEN